MIIIKDALGNEFDYWPITGLIAGNDSQVLTIIIDVISQQDGFLRASDSPYCVVWGREVGDISYIDLTNDGFDLSSYVVGQYDFEIYVEALTPFTGARKVGLKVSASQASPAGWTV